MYTFILFSAFFVCVLSLVWARQWNWNDKIFIPDQMFRKWCYVENGHFSLEFDYYLLLHHPSEHLTCKFHLIHLNRNWNIGFGFGAFRTKLFLVYWNYHFELKCWRRGGLLFECDMFIGMYFNVHSHLRGWQWKRCNDSFIQTQSHTSENKT